MPNCYLFNRINYYPLITIENVVINFIYSRNVFLHDQNKLRVYLQIFSKIKNTRQQNVVTLSIKTFY